MNIRRIAAIAVLALMLVPTSGRAIGDAARPVSGSSCTVGNEMLTFNGEVGQWEGRSSVTCPPKPDGSPNNQAQIDVTFTVTLVRGVNTVPEPGLAGSSVFSSSDPINNTPIYSCITCPGVQAFGTTITLTPGLYVMKTQAVITQNTQAGTVYRRGNHSTCFLVRGETTEQVTPVPGCSL